MGTSSHAPGANLPRTLANLARANRGGESEHPPTMRALGNRAPPPSHGNQVRARLQSNKGGGEQPSNPRSRVSRNPTTPGNSSQPSRRESAPATRNQPVNSQSSNSAPHQETSHTGSSPANRTRPEPSSSQPGTHTTRNRQPANSLHANQTTGNHTGIARKNRGEPGARHRNQTAKQSSSQESTRQPTATTGTSNHAPGQRE